MATFAQRGAAAHRNRMPVANGETIQLRRGQATVTVEGAMQSPNSVSVMNAEGLEVQVVLTDWWLPTDKVLPFDPSDPSSSEPRAGDEITSESGLVYEAMRPSESTPAVGSVCANKFWLVHTKETGVA